MPDPCVPTWREMNVWIAEHLYGQPTPQHKADSDGPSIGIWTPCDICDIHGETEYVWRCREFSTNPTAAYEAEGRVPEELRSIYLRELCYVTDAFMDKRGAHALHQRDWKLLRRTPAQICEAIYRAMEGER